MISSVDKNRIFNVTLSDTYLVNALHFENTQTSLYKYTYEN